jgi:hypothetical protein
MSQPPEPRQECVEDVPEVLDGIARDMQRLAHELRIYPIRAASFKVVCPDGVPPGPAIEVTIRMVTKEATFVAVWKDGALEPARENSLVG